MNRLTFFSLYLLLLTLPAPAQLSGPPDYQTSFQAGNEAAQAGRYEEAVEHYEACIAAGGLSSNVLWNAGTAALLAGNGEKAVDFYGRVRELEPDNWRVRAKLIQAYQLNQQLEERDRERTSLVEAWKEAGPESELGSQKLYCRDQFQVEERRVMVFEHFELEGERAVKCVFLVLKPGKMEEDYRLSLGSYEATNRSVHESEKLDPNIRVYHLDGYYEGGNKHSTYAFYRGLPDYDKLKEVVKKAITGEIRPVSGSQRKKDGDVDVQMSVPAEE